MKRIIFYCLNLVLIPALLISCGKTTKGKVTNEWKVTSYEISEQRNFNGDQIINTASITQTTYASTFIIVSSNGQPGVSEASTGTVNLHEFIIKKDGTWTWSLDFDRPIDASGSQDAQFVHSTRERTGTWSFIRKSKGDEFKKNERLLLNVLTDHEVLVQTNQSTGESVTNILDHSFSIGDEIMVYTVAASKNKKLQLERETDISSVSNYPSTDAKKMIEKITLSEK